MKTLLPPGWPRPIGYSNGILAEGRQVYVAGMVGWTPEGDFPGTFTDQFRLALENTVAVLAEGGAGPEHIVRMTWYVTNLDEYRDNLPGIGDAWREVIGKHFPVMAVIGVSGLVESAAKLEIESTAVIP